MSTEDPSWRVHLRRMDRRPQPRHVHVYRDGTLVVKWDLDAWQPMKGRAGARVERLLRELVEEGKL
jgi:hypothetical protein